ncbi:MAG: heavy-metal-associated domain-containing protein [Proteobacteria bacterium]|nr:heavy-metal-associated domain-containing protein [Pseudomonadota bacterium]
MTCNHCVKNASRALESTEGVEVVEVRLEPGSATVNGMADVAQLIAAVKGAGYEAELIS